MKRVLVLGCAGAGKSTLAAEIAARRDLPLIYLDSHYWTPGWVELEREAWRDKVSELAAPDSWVMDGNYLNSFDLRLPRADTAILLDVSTHRCLGRVLRRIWRYRGQTRPDMPKGCPERFDIGFLRYVMGYRRTHRPRVLEALRDFEGTLVILRTPEEVRRFMETLK